MGDLEKPGRVKKTKVPERKWRVTYRNTDWKETGGLYFDWTYPVMRLKDPLGIDIN